MSVISPPRLLTAEEFDRVCLRLEIPVEWVGGCVLPKAGTTPLPDWVIEKVLDPDVPISSISYAFPMATFRHADLIRKLSRALDRIVDPTRFEVFASDPQIYITLTGNYRTPDVSVVPAGAAKTFEGERLTNPVVLIEVMSPSNAGADFQQKRKEYKSIASVQEYWLIWQHEARAEQFVRRSSREWLYRDYDTETNELLFPSLDVSVPFAAVFDR